MGAFVTALYTDASRRPALQPEETPPVLPRVLVIDDDPDLLSATAELVGSEGFLVHAAPTLTEGIAALIREDFAVVLADAIAPTAQDTWHGVRLVLAAAHRTPVGLISGHRIAHEDAQKLGVAFHLQKPYEPAELFAALGAHATTAEPTAAERAAIAAYFDALTRKDWTALGEVCAEDVRYHLPGEDPTYSRTVMGREAFVRFSEETFSRFADARFTLEALFRLPFALVSRFKSAWTAADGAPAGIEGAVLFRLENGRIHEIGVRLDLQELARRTKKPAP